MREQIILIRKWKARALILVVTALTTAFPAAAQQGSIALPVRKLSAVELFENIQRQTNYMVAANSARTQNLSINIDRPAVEIRAALEKMLQGSGLAYRMEGNYIIITEAPVTAPKAGTVKIARNVTGAVTDRADGGAPVEAVTVRVVDFPSKEAVTAADGRFRIEGVPAGSHIVRLTSADGATIRFREITVPAGSDAEVSLVMGGELWAASPAQPQALSLPQASKATAFYVPGKADNTVHAFSDEPKTEYSFVPSAKFNTGYLPRAAVKTNLLYLATTTLNVAVEFSLAPRWTLDIAAGLNPWDLNDRKGGIRHGLVQPEARYWFCNRFEKWFVGLHGIYGQYQIQDIDLSPLGNDLTGKRYDGWGAGAGFSVGYHLPMGKRWGWEFTLGAGYIYLDYDKYNCGECDTFAGSRTKHWFGPTKAGVSLIFMIK